jgi:hypothetical protein
MIGTALKGESMKILFSMMVLAFANVAFSQLVVEAPVKHLFIPYGFDNNDNIELVVTGEFPSTCYSSHKSEVEVNGDIVDIKVTALKKESEVCEQIMIGFKEVVRIGTLQGGDYKVVVNQGSASEQQENVTIEEASSNSVDEYVYANVEYIDLGFTGGTSGSAMIMAQTPGDCYDFDRVEYLSNKKDTLSVLPILKKVKPVCGKMKVRVEIPITFDPAQFSYSQILLFTRSLQGQSVSTIIERQ